MLETGVAVAVMLDGKILLTQWEATGLSRQAFYLKYWASTESDQIIRETPPYGGL
jgi:hypothetical protein